MLFSLNPILVRSVIDRKSTRQHIQTRQALAGRPRVHPFARVSALPFALFPLL